MGNFQLQLSTKHKKQSFELSTKPNIMKRSTKKWALAFMSGVVLLTFACKKDEPIPSPTPIDNGGLESFSSVKEFRSSKAPQAVSFMIQAQTGGTYTTQKGSVITIPANAFINASGQLVTGSVQVRFKEVFSKAEMIYSGILPVSNGNVLESGGEYFIEAIQNGAQLRVADNVQLQVKIPAQAQGQGMLLFFADPKEEVDSLNWNLVDSSSTGSNFSFSSSDNSYNINLDSTGWGNIDQFNNTAQYFDIQFNLTGLSGLNNSNTNAYAIFKNQNTVWPTGSFNGINNSIIQESHLADVPMNVLVISVVNSQLYYGLLDVTPQQGVNYTIPMLATTSANLDQIINGLP